MKKLLLPSLILGAGFALTGCDKKDDPYTPADTSKALPLECLIQKDMLLTDHNPNGIDYIVSCDVEVKKAILTVGPGVTIQFKENTSLKIHEDAAIAVNGTASKQVIMKGERSGACWRGLLIKSKDSRNNIHHLTISNTGYDDFFHDVFAGFVYDAKIAIGVEGSASITNTIVEDCGGIGIIYGSNASITGFSSNTISHCALYPLMINGSMLTNDRDLSSSVYKDNSANYIALYSYTSNSIVDNAVFFHETPIPYLVYNSLEFQKNVTMDAGVEIKMEEDRFLFTTRAATTWNINGTASKPVVISGKVDAPGYWRGILLGDNSKGTFSYLNISGGGRDYVGFNQPFKANINVGDTEPAYLTINNCTSSDNSNNCDVGVHDRGALLVNNSPAITNVCKD